MPFPYINIKDTQLRNEGFSNHKYFVSYALKTDLSYGREQKQFDLCYPYDVILLLGRVSHCLRSFAFNLSGKFDSKNLRN